MHLGPATYSLFFKLALSFSVACLLTSVSAELVNTTVDDTSGDPLTGATVLYEPASSWRPGNLSLCMNCTARPDAFRASGETWHEGLSLPSLSGEQSQVLVLTATLPFNGSAVYVYCIIAPFWSTDLAFYLDGEHTGAFALTANTSRAYEYGVLVYASATLPPAQHTLTIESGSGSGNDTLVLLDRIIYTHDSATRASNTTSPGAASSTSLFSGPSFTPDSQPHLTTSASIVYAITIPCVIGGMVLVGVLVALWGKLWRRYKRAGLPPSALYRRSVEAGGTQPGPESGWVGHGGGPKDLVAGASLKVAEDVEAAAAVGQDRPGVVGPRELPERTRSEQGHGTPHHGTAAEEIEEVSRS